MDPGILAAGAVNAVRGSRSSAEELLYIYSHSDRLDNNFHLNHFMEFRFSFQKMFCATHVAISDFYGFTVFALPFQPSLDFSKSEL